MSDATTAAAGSNNTTPSPSVLICELSGQPLSLNDGNVVVTPSGHVCLKRLLLTKLAENGSMDPFVSNDQQIPLSEDDLIVLRRSSNNNKSTTTGVSLFPRPNVTSIPNILTLLQREYEALVLELFDTRQTLSETRKELSQSLYQNDAAVRVIARLSMERDEARQQLQHYKNEGGGVVVKQQQEEEEPTSKGDNEPATKKLKTSSSNDKTTTPSTLSMTIPKEHHTIMMDTWKELSLQRKASKKKQQSIDQMKFLETKSWHKSSGTKHGIVSTSSYGPFFATAGLDKQICIYDSMKKQVIQTISVSGSGEIQAMDVGKEGEMILVALSSTPTKESIVRLYNGQGDGTIIAETTITKDDIIDVDIHPSNKFVCILTSTQLLVMDAMTLKPFAEYKADSTSTFTSGKLHPDGMMYVAGNTSGQLIIFDFNSMKIASTLSSPNNDDSNSSIVSICFSSNGYHLSSTTSFNNNNNTTTTLIWDLRKQKIIKTINDMNIKSICFDVSGKMIAYLTASTTSNEQKIFMTIVKDWDKSMKILELQKNEDQSYDELTWMNNGTFIVTSSIKRSIQFYGNQNDDDDDTKMDVSK